MPTVDPGERLVFGARYSRNAHAYVHCAIKPDSARIAPVACGSPGHNDVAVLTAIAVRTGSSVGQSART